ncbi:MAG TPA: hypothetical protein VFZ59_10485 [Verrucomicrobiae bacterium]|nr:hypothetical protein [Verrucomicrobiae bacterium]
MKRSALLFSGMALMFMATAAIAEDPLQSLVGANHRLVRSSTAIPLPGGRVIERSTGYTEIAVGMHYLENGQWLPSREEIELFQGGAVARHGPYSVIFAQNIATDGAIDLLTADGFRLKSHVLGLGLYNAANGNSILLAETTDSIGQLHAPNVIIYPSAFDDVAADLRYTYRQNAFAQDVILRQKIALPQGFPINSTYLEVWTEFVNCPTPERQVVQRGGQDDENLTFGSMRIGPGKAFALEAAGMQRSLPVTKKWITIEGRSFLVESIRVAQVNAELDRMGFQEAAIKRVRKGNAALAANQRPFPKAPPAKPRGEGPKIKTAMVDPPGKGFVIDYDLGGVIETLRLQGDTTYNITNSIDVTQLIVEGGTVVKFPGTVSLTVSGSLVCETDFYNPAHFTSKNDNTIGAAVSSSTGIPEPDPFECPMLYLPGTARIEHFRFSYANPAIYTDVAATFTNRHVQFVHCISGIWSDAAATIKLQNVLMHDIAGTALTGDGWTVVAEHLTASTCHELTHYGSAAATFKGTNCLLVNVTNAGNATLATNFTVAASGSTILQTVGAGGGYLPPNSPYRGIGSDKITSQLRDDLRKLTTYPPILIAASSGFATNLHLVPQAQRDLGSVDIGFHYYPLDFVFGGVNVTNATVTASNGVVIGTRNVNGYGLGIGNNAVFVSIGKPESPNRIVRYNLVQEQATTNWATSSREWRIYTGFPNSSFPSRVTTRFTHISTHASGGENFYTSDGQDAGVHCFKDTEFHNGDVWSYRPTTSLTNCLLNRSGLNILDGDESINPSVRHCTFRGGTHNFARANGGTWTFKDNLFDAVEIPFQEAVLIHDYNAYTTNSARLTNAAPRDIVLTVTNIHFQAGTLGRFYLPTNLSSHWPLTNSSATVAAYRGGSTNANLLGLWHFTCLTNNVKETNTVVDTGYHYVATDANGIPVDSGDGDGIPDYLEDFNGNGTLDSGETNWQNASDQGFRVWITRPKRGTPIP